MRIILVRSAEFYFVAICMALLALATACSTVQNRKQERSAAYGNLPAEVRNLVDQGQIERGMDTNAVYIALGPPSAIEQKLASSPPETVWIYEANRAVHRPSWSYVPGPNGYWTYEPTTLHYSERYTRAEVVFEKGRVVDYKKFKAR